MIKKETVIASASACVGEEVELPRMLDARERRVILQNNLLSGYGKPLISFTLNIPGPVKVLPLVPEAFACGLSMIEEAITEHGFSILHQELRLDATGLESFWAVEAETRDLKAAMVSIEDGTPLGRLFDIDIIVPGVEKASELTASGGRKVSREELGLPPRTCLICGQPAHACARSRNHPVPELVDKINCILRKELLQHGI